MALQVPIFAMDRNEVARFNEMDQLGQLVSAGMTRDVDRRHTVVIDLGAALIEMVDHAIDRTLVARN